jgi:enediyne biosynthesis protein E4
MNMSAFLRKRAVPLISLVLLAGLYTLAQPHTPPDAEIEALAQRFHFTRFDLPEPQGMVERPARAVNPSMERISAWVSAMGAAAALGDLDADGLPNDICHVEPRDDKVSVFPVPGTGNRYKAFTLDPAPLPYDQTMAPMGCLIADLNEDSRMDLLVYYWGRTPVAFLRKTDSQKTRLGREDFVATEVAPGGERWYSNDGALADLDGDGHLDLVIGNTYPDGARLLDANAREPAVMPESVSSSGNGGWNRLLLWTAARSGSNPFVQFRDVSKQALTESMARGWTLALAAGDLDGDGLPEIYFANDFGPDRLLHNLSRPGKLKFAELRGKSGFTTPKSFVLGQDSCKGMGADLADLNGDGWMDIYVSNIATPKGLQEGHFLWLSTGQPGQMRTGQAPYVQAADRLGLGHSGWGWDSKLDDFDNDGVLEAVQATGFVKGSVNRWPELQALGTANDALLTDPRHWPKFQPGTDISGHEPNAFFVRDASGHYYDIANKIGLGQPMVTRGVAIADVDGDGDLDFVYANQWEKSYFYRNDGKRRGAYLSLRLLLPLIAQSRPTDLPGHRPVFGLGHPAIGAQASVQLPDGRRLTAQVDGGNGQSGKRSPEIHFGLGNVPADRSLQVSIKWRDQRGQMRERTLELAPGWHTVLLG